MFEQVAQGKTLFTSYSIHAITGEVMGVKTRSETETSGTISGGHGMNVGGTGASSPVRGSIETKTTRFQSLFLKDDAGKEHSIELVNYLVPCREGHKLTLLSLHTGSNSAGRYIHAYNHNTDQHVENDGAAAKSMFPMLMLLAAVALLGFFVFRSVSADPNNDGFEVLAMTFIATGLGGLALYAGAHVIAMIKAGHARGNSAYKQYLASLSAAG